MDAAAKFLNGDGDGGELAEDASRDDIDAMFAADAMSMRPRQSRNRCQSR